MGPDRGPHIITHVLVIGICAVDTIHPGYGAMLGESTSCDDHPNVIAKPKGSGATLLSWCMCTVLYCGAGASVPVLYCRAWGMCAVPCRSWGNLVM